MEGSQIFGQMMAKMAKKKMEDKAKEAGSSEVDIMDKEESPDVYGNKDKATKIKDSFVAFSDEDKKMGIEDGDEPLEKFLSALSEKYQEEESSDEELELLKEALLKLKG